MAPRHHLEDEPEDRLERIEAKLCTIHDRLFIDNGEPCLQSRVRMHSERIALILWVGSALVTAVIGIVVDRLIN